MAIDSLNWDFVVMMQEESGIANAAKEGAYMKGLFLEGARWDPQQGFLVESNDKELFTQMSPFLLKPEVNRAKPKEGIYDCPCYKTLKRAGLLSTTGHSTNFVLPLEVPSNEPEAYWIKRGVALFCSLNY